MRLSKLAVTAWGALVVLAVLAILAITAVVYFWPGGTQAELRRTEGQNVLLVTIDTLRADALGAYGGPAATPALDRLAADGVRFDFAHAHAVLTLPSHASILTGEYPHRHGVRENSGYRLPGGARTVATLLKQAGYATAAFVAAFPVHSRFGLNAGFDVYDDRFGDGFGPADFAMPERPASAVVPLAREWIAEGAPGRQDPAGCQAVVCLGARVRSARAVSAAAAFRHAVRREALLRRGGGHRRRARAAAGGRAELGTADAGDRHRRPRGGARRSRRRSARDLRLRVHAPRSADHRQPGRSAAASKAARQGEVASVAARHVDILPTILDAVGLPVPDGLPGRTLLPRKEREAGAAPRTTYFEAMSGMLNNGWAPLAGVLVDRDKFIDLPVAERFDLAADAAEQSNLYGRSPERDRTLAAALHAFAPTLPGQRATEDPAAAASLRALGYVSGGAAPKAKYTEADDPKRLIDIDAAIHRALEAFGAGRPEEAARIYRQVIDRRPDMAIAYRHLALLAWQRGESCGDRRAQAGPGARRDRRADAGAAWRVPHRHGPPGRGHPHPRAGGEEPGRGGRRAQRPGHRLRARRTARGRAARVRAPAEALPGSSAPLENLGVLALEQGTRMARPGTSGDAAAPDFVARPRRGRRRRAPRRDRRAACDAWTRAVALDPSNLEALFSLGVNLARDGRFNEARPYLEQFQQTAPPDRHADALREVARLLQAQRRP